MHTSSHRVHNTSSTHSNILSILSDGRFHSGSELGKSLNISRAAIWKHIRHLIGYGLEIYSVPGKGYCLEKPIELLDNVIIDAHLTDQCKKNISKLDVCFSLDSTNDYLLGRIDNESIHGYTILSEHQSKGRGRRSTNWYSPPGAGIYLSIGWRFGEINQNLNCLSLSMGVAIIRALNKFNIHGLGLKWPNDIYHDLNKLGGVLVETRMEHAGQADIVVGVGINISVPQKIIQSIDQPVTDISNIVGSVPSRNLLAAELINEITHTLCHYQQSGFEKDIEQWRSLDVAREKKVTLILQGKENIGRVIGIDDNGLLLMSIGGVIKKFMSGQISFKISQ